MNLVDSLVERKISEAIARGELSGLPGEGAPLEFDDDMLIPDHLSMANRILRNAGFVPPEMAVLREIRDLERRIEVLSHNDERGRALRKLQYLRLRLEASGRFWHVLHSASASSEKRLDRPQNSGDANGGQAVGEQS
jgi:hypothetical protein